MSPVSRFVSVLLFGLVLGAPAVGVAAPTTKPPTDARGLKAVGDRAMDEARPAEALEAYERSYALKPDPALLYNQARAHLALTNHPAALAFLQRFNAEAPASMKARLVGLDAFVADVRKKVSRLTLVIDVPGASVRLRDATLGQSPLPAALPVNAGTAVLEVRAPGFETVRRTLELPGDQDVALTLALERTDIRGTVVLRSPQPGVRIQVRGTSRGSLPLELSLPQGTYPIELSKEGYETLKSSLVVVAGERRERSLTLAKKPALYTRWWFWTGIGVVVAGSVVTAIALTTERSPGSGSIAPGQVASSFSF